jgi:hypothetical protein
VRLIVWVDDWQLQCCGTPFAIGDEVTWTLSPAPDRNWLSNIFGPESAQRITHTEEHHGQTDLVATRGRVIDISAAHCRFTEHPRGRGTEVRHVTGSGELHPVTEADGYESGPAEMLFLGYVVELEAYGDVSEGRSSR